MYSIILRALRGLVTLTLFAGIVALVPSHADAASVTRISWDSQPQYNRFVMEFDELPKQNTVDSLQQSKLFYVDLYGLKQNYKRRLLTVSDETLSYVDAISYPEREVLRLVFYAKQATCTFNVQTLANPPRIVIDTMREGAARPAPMDESKTAVSRESGSAALNAALPMATATPAPSQGSSTVFEPPGIPKPRLRPQGNTGGNKIVIIDPGHGGANSGATSNMQVQGKNVTEKELTYQFAYHLMQVINSSPNMVALVTRADDSTVGLQDRVNFAENNGGDLFISLHLNDGGGNSKARGMEVFYLNEKGSVDAAVKALEEKENRDVNGDANFRSGTILKDLMSGIMKDKVQEWQYESYVFCRWLEQSMLTRPFFSSNYRGIKNANFVVLKNFKMPAILLEIGFITNSEDLPFLINSNFQQETAVLLYNAINNYFSDNDPNFKPHHKAVMSR